MNLAYKPYVMVDKILPSELYIISKNNIKDIEEDYKQDIEANGSAKWGERSISTCLMNIVKTILATIEKDFDYFTHLEQRHNVEIPLNLIVIK